MARAVPAVRVVAVEVSLPDDMSPEEAVDLLCALAGLELYLQLAGRGWTPDRWERFVLDALGHALLQAPG